MRSQLFNIVLHAARDRFMVYTNKSKTQGNISWKTFLPKVSSLLVVCTDITVIKVKSNTQMMLSVSNWRLPINRVSVYFILTCAKILDSLIWQNTLLQTPKPHHRKRPSSQRNHRKRQSSQNFFH